MTVRQSIMRSCSTEVVASVMVLTCVLAAGASHAQQSAVPPTGDAAARPVEAPPALPPVPAASAATPINQVGEIVVTAQKRRENLQNVPISVVAITANRVQAAGVAGTLDIGQVTPGLTVSQTTNSPLLFLRGVGTALSTPGDEGSVNLLVDGVVFISLPGSVFSFNNIDQIEVLRGPQGTLFGRNAAGGVVSITTRDPKFTPSADILAGYGNYGTFSSSFYGTTGLTQNIAADLAIQYDNQAEGFGRNLYNGSRVDRTDDFSARSKILWDVDAHTTVKLSYDHETTGGDAGVPRHLLPGTVGLDGETAPAKFWDVSENVQPASHLDANGGNLNIHHDMSWAQITTITAYRDTVSGYSYDQDSTAAPIVDAIFNTHETQLSQEVQLASPQQSRIKWIVGGFYLDASAKLLPLALSGFAFAPIGGFASDYGVIDTRSIAGFGQVTVPLGDRTNLTGGLRYTDDRKQLSFTETSGVGVLVPPLQESATFNKLTWHASLDHKLTSDLLAYVSASSGYKSGSFNIINPANPTIQPETLTDYEGGLKTQLFDNRLRLNLSGFYYDYKNIQVSQIVSGQTFILNAAAGTVYGADIDFETASLYGFNLSGGAELLHARYDKFPNAPASFPLPATCTPTPMILPGPRVGGNLICSIDASGKQFVEAPDVDTTLTAAYSYPSQFGALGASVTYAYRSSFPWEPDGRLRQGPTSLVNGQFSYTTLDKRYVVRLYAKNLTNEKYYLQESSSVSDSGEPAPPRTYGFTVAAHF